MVVSEYIDSSGIIELTVEYLGYRDAVDELTRYLVYKRFEVIKRAERDGFAVAVTAEMPVAAAVGDRILLAAISEFELATVRKTVADYVKCHKFRQGISAPLC